MAAAASKISAPCHNHIIINGGGGEQNICALSQPPIINSGEQGATAASEISAPC
jgi:hypothetical protein